MYRKQSTLLDVVLEKNFIGGEFVAQECSIHPQPVGK